MRSLIALIRKKSILALFAFMSVGCSAEKVSSMSDLVKINVSGNVVSIKKSTYDSLEDYKNKVGLQQISLFNDNGNIKIRELLNPDGSVIQKTEYIYNDNYLVKATELNADNEPTLTMQYIHDSKDRLLKVNYKKKGKVFTRYAYEYDDKGNKTLELTYDADSQLVSKISYIYNEKKQLIEEGWFYADGALYVKIKTQYDPVSGNKKAERRERNNGNQYMSLTYNDKGDVEKVIEWDPYSRSEVQLSTKYIDYKYEYDEHGNWTSLKTISSVNNKITSVIVRELKYNN